jgi:hypothetical protein
MQGMLRAMDSIGDILVGRKSEEPREVGIIKRFVLQNFRATPTVMMGQREITVIVRGAALAGALRPRLLELQELCTTDKRLVIRIQ